MAQTKLELELEKKKLQLQITKALTVKEELDMKVMEQRVQVERMEKHQKLQDEVIVKTKQELMLIEEQIRNYKEEV